MKKSKLILVTLVCVTAVANEMNTPAALTSAFLRTYLRQPGYALLEGHDRDELAPYLSKAFLRNLDNASKCERDWIRQQPQGSTDKPPFVDCCLFAASADWFPNSYLVGRPVRLDDGRYRVPIEYRYRTPTEDHSWRVAVIAVKEGGRYVIDDFIENVDAQPPDKPWTLSRDWDGCRAGRWVGVTNNDRPH